ncbi:hypothetical protein ACFLRN_10955 [Thermoproteota archaeon]
MFVTLIALPACNAVITPVEVERVKDICFIRVRGDHHTQSFLLHYVNLSPGLQGIIIHSGIYIPGGIGELPHLEAFTNIAPGASIDVTLDTADYGYALQFEVFVIEGLVPFPLVRPSFPPVIPWTSVVIPPKA